MEARQAWIAMADRPTQVLVQRVLRTAGFRVLEFAGLGGLLDRLAAGGPDLFVLDREALLGHEAELAARLRRADRRPGVILVDDPDAVEPLPEVDPVTRYVLARPIDGVKLLRTAHRLTGSSAAAFGPPARIPDLIVCGFGEAAHLLADDLGKAGYRTYLIANGVVPNSLVQAGHYRCLLLDLQASGADRLLRQIGRLPGQRPIVAVGRVDWQRADAMRGLERVTCLEKPVQMTQLLRAVAEYLPIPAAAMGVRA